MNTLIEKLESLKTLLSTALLSNIFLIVKYPRETIDLILFKEANKFICLFQLLWYILGFLGFVFWVQVIYNFLKR